MIGVCHREKRVFTAVSESSKIALPKLSSEVAGNAPTSL